MLRVAPRGGHAQSLDEMWVFDPMTHVYNRAGFFKFSEDILSEATLFSGKARPDKFGRSDRYMASPG